MFGLDTLGVGLSGLIDGEQFSANPVIRSVAGVLALQETGVIICDKTVALLAETLADFGERYDVDPETIQYALQAAEPSLVETGEA